MTAQNKLLLSLIVSAVLNVLGGLGIIPPITGGPAPTPCPPTVAATIPHP